MRATLRSPPRAPDAVLGRFLASRESLILVQ